MDVNSAGRDQSSCVEREMYRDSGVQVAVFSPLSRCELIGIFSFLHAFPRCRKVVSCVVVFRQRSTGSFHRSRYRTVPAATLTLPAITSRPSPWHRRRALANRRSRAATDVVSLPSPSSSSHLASWISFTAGGRITSSMASIDDFILRLNSSFKLKL